MRLKNKYDEWFSNNYKDMDDTPSLESMSYEAWSGCKQEVLKIIDSLEDWGDLEFVNKYDLLGAIRRKIRNEI